MRTGIAAASRSGEIALTGSCHLAIRVSSRALFEYVVVVEANQSSSIARILHSPHWPATKQPSKTTSSPVTPGSALRARCTFVPQFFMQRMFVTLITTVGADEAFAAATSAWREGEEAGMVMTTDGRPGEPSSGKPVLIEISAAAASPFESRAALALKPLADTAAMRSSMLARPTTRARRNGKSIVASAIADMKYKNT